ncbi:MAG: threonine/serine exporter family protein [Bacteroidota bacterium]|nr:threonine/serine exporter family protein [Bacteroidota bacterium]
MNQHQNKEIKEIGTLLLEIGALLMSSGASTARIRITINRISEAFGCTADLFITHRALTLTLNDEENEDLFSSIKRTSPHGVNFKVVSGISRMSWRVVEENWTIDQIKQEINRLTSLPHYPRIVVLLLVSLAGASFCRLFGGNFVEMGITFLASFAGLFIRQEAHKFQFNPYLCIYFGALTASLVSGAFMKLGLDITLEHAFATSVLFLIPGVPLINTFTDLIDGNILNGLLRGVHGLIIAFCIALGLLSAIYIYHF